MISIDSPKSIKEWQCGCLLCNNLRLANALNIMMRMKLQVPSITQLVNQSHMSLLIPYFLQLINTSQIL